MKEYRKYVKKISRLGFRLISENKHAKFQNDEGIVLTVSKSLSSAQRQMEISLRDIKNARNFRENLRSS